MKARAVMGLVAVLMLGCGTTPPPKPPRVDPTEQWIQAGKKVEFAITQTKSMIQRARGATYLPDLYMRLAELYTERARYAWLVVYERRKGRGDDSRAVEAPEARLLKNLAVGVYGRVLREFPGYKRGDEALFLMAHEYRELGEFDTMRETYERLIESYPQSPHRLEAYLALGDHAFDANDLAKAEGYYNQILAAPPSPVHPLARYKLAWVRVNLQDCKGAVRLFEAALRERPPAEDGEASATLLRTQKNVNVVREALVDLAYCYPDIYADKPAVPYFRSLAASAVDYLAAMRRLSKRFAIKEMHAQAVGALREVLNGSTGDDEAVEMARQLHDSITKGTVFDRPADDVERMVRVLDGRLEDYHLTAAARAKLVSEFELYARDIATRAHVAAKESQSTAAMSQVADAYRAYLARFEQAAARDEIRENHAEALLAAQRHFDAGRAYEEVESTSKKGETRKQARLNAIAAYQQALEQPSLGRLQRVQAWGGIRTLGRRVIAETPSEPAIVGIKLSIARSHYETGDYEQAAQLFYAVARQYPETHEGVAAAHLSLDALRQADDLEGLTTVGRRLIADRRLGNDDVKKELRDIVAKAAQRQVAEVTVTDSGDRQEQLLAMARRHRGSELGEEAFYNTLLLARSHGEIEQFYELGEQFLTDYPSSPKRIEVLGALASVGSDIADFRMAGKYMAAAFAADPQGKEAGDRLYAAASIHSVLGDASAAKEILKLAERGNNKLDDLLLVLARSGSLSTLEAVLGTASINGPVATFFRGYLAFRRGDHEVAGNILSRLSGASPDLSGRARFLMGEMAYAAFRNAVPQTDLAATVDTKVKLLAGVEKAFTPVIEGHDTRWAMAGLARMADSHAKYAAFLRGLDLPASLGTLERKQLKDTLGAQAAEVDKRANELRVLCMNTSKKAGIFSEAARSCLLGQPLPDTIAMYPQTRIRSAGEIPGAPALRKVLLKNPKDVDALPKLAELHLGAGDVGVALLLLERVQALGARKASVENLLGVTLHRLNEPQDAAEAFEKAVALEPGEARFRLNLAAHCAAFGHVERARAELQKAGAVPSTVGAPADHPELSLLSQLAAQTKGKVP